MWQCHCRNGEIKKKNLAIVAMALPKMGEKKKKRGYEIYERVKKKVVMSTIFLQYFHNKSQVISSSKKFVTN